MSWKEENRQPALFGGRYPEPSRPSARENKVLSVRKITTALDVPDAGLAMLTKWFSGTRLETRTKESNIYASIWVTNPDA